MCCSLKDACGLLMQGLESVTVVGVASGGNHCAAIARDGSIYVWGRCGAQLLPAAFLGSSTPQAHAGSMRA